MPPKSKGSGKKAAKARTPTLIDGLSKEEISKEQMEEHIVRQREEMDREREERNYFQLERDKVFGFCEISDRQLEVIKAELKNSEKDIEEDEGCHQVELKVYKQKMKHLLCEHQNTIAELKADHLVSMEVLQKEQQQLETELHKKMTATMVDIQELDNEKFVKKIELKHNEEMTETRNNCEKQLTDAKSKSLRKTELLTQELDNIRKNETIKMEELWNKRLTKLMKDHEHTRHFNNSLFHNIQQDSEVVDSLKKQIKDTKMKLEETEKDLAPVFQDKGDLTERLSNIERENTENERKVKYRTLKEDPSEKVKEKQLNDLKAEHEALEEKFRMLQLEEDELYKAFTQNIENVQHKLSLKNTTVEKKLQDLTESLEKTQAQFSSVCSASNMDQTALSVVANKTEKGLNSFNNSVKSAQYEKAQISKACDDLLLTSAVGVPVEDFCVNPDGSSLAGDSSKEDLDLGFAHKSKATSPVK